ncbi:heme ABC exporter ATP-binding protein CcmA [Paramylibacter ulvae]|nr:heme ABC exporter ATP-binding protein CcmA [Amylibacter ulvae]
MSLSVQNISCLRAGRAIFENLSFDLKKGDCLVLRGPNGSGKTTLLKTLAGILPSATGEIHCDPAQISYAGHLDAIKAQLTVRENLTFWAGIYDAGNLDRVLSEFDLTTLADRYGQTLSAGQRRRLGLARMILTECQIWLLDEPTNSLDAEHAAIFAKAVNKHCSNGGVAVLSSHIDLHIPNTQTLDLSDFAPTGATETDPFLQGGFS